VQALSITAARRSEAGAATNASILNFTGLKDTYGVPIMITTCRWRRCATRSSGRPGRGLESRSWMNWFAHTLWIMMSSVWIANWLTAEAGLFIGIIAPRCGS
jgi:hypothetical protein